MILDKKENLKENVSADLAKSTKAKKHLPLWPREDIKELVKKINIDKSSLSDEQLLRLVLSFALKDKLDDILENMENNLGDASVLLDPDAICLYFGKTDEDVMAFLKTVKTLSERVDNIMKSNEIKKNVNFISEQGGYGNFLVDYIGRGLLEELCVIYLDESNCIVEVKKYSNLERGSVVAEIVDAVKTATKNKASKLIVGHNHPSGSLECAESDFLITRTFFSHLRAAGITLESHFVVTDEGYKILYSEETL